MCYVYVIVAVIIRTLGFSSRSLVGLVQFVVVKQTIAPDFMLAYKPLWLCVGLGSTHIDYMHCIMNTHSHVIHGEKIVFLDFFR